MKINVLPILRDHWSTLYDRRHGRVSTSDLFVFFILPILLGASTTLAGLKFDAAAYNASITFFGIFVALLLNIQVAIFGIFQRKWNIPENCVSKKLAIEDAEKRRVILSEVNTNISYLIVFGTACLVYFLFSYIIRFSGIMSSMLSIVLYTHFIATFLMVVKRSHILFKKEYSDSPL